MLLLPFILGAWLKSVHQVWLVVSWIALANTAMALVEWYGFGLDTYGLAGNPNYLGCLLALCLATAIGYQRWLFAFAFAGATLWTQSRGAILAGGLACFIGLWHRYRATGFILALLAILASLRLKGGPIDGSLYTRLGIWQDTVNHLTVFGSGFGSFSASYATFAVKTNMFSFTTDHVYNDFLELIFDLGLGSIPLWVLIAISFEGRNWPDRLVCLTFGTLSLTYFPLWFLGPLFTLSLGHLSQTKEENPWLVGASQPRITSTYPARSGNRRKLIG